MSATAASADLATVKRMAARLDHPEPVTGRTVNILTGCKAGV
jgi:hypothetical protein